MAEPVLTAEQRAHWNGAVDDARIFNVAYDETPVYSAVLIVVADRLAWLEAEREKLIGEIERWQAWEVSTEQG